MSPQHFLEQLTATDMLSKSERKRAMAELRETHRQASFLAQHRAEAAFHYMMAIVHERQHARDSGESAAMQSGLSRAFESAVARLVERMDEWFNIPAHQKWLTELRVTAIKRFSTHFLIAHPYWETKCVEWRTVLKGELA